MRIGISADSTCDLPQELVEKYDIRLNAMPFSLGERLCHDGVDGTSQDVFDYVQKTGKLPTTSAYNAFEYKEHFEKALKDYDALIHVSFSTEVSSTGNNARLAAEEFDNVYVIDSRNLSAGFATVVMEVVDRVNAGMEINQIIEEVNGLVDKVQSSFVIDTLKYLHKGGRCSGIAVLGANILKIKPRISVLNGKMEVTKKYRGKIEEVAKTFFEETVTECPPATKRAFVVLSTPVDIKEYFDRRLKELGFEEVYYVQAGPSICIHCGEKTVGLMYLGK